MRVRGPLERTLELLALVDERPALLFELGLPQCDRLLTAGDAGAALGQGRVKRYRRGRGGRVGLRSREMCTVGARIHERRKHDSDRDQRCGNDGFHGRSSPPVREDPNPVHCLAFGERPSGPRETHERMPRSEGRLPIRLGWLYGWLAGGGRPRGRIVGWLLHVHSRLQDVRDLLVFCGREGRSFAASHRSTGPGRAQCPERAPSPASPRGSAAFAGV
jgi:hypothetical protein